MVAMEIILPSTSSYFYVFKNTSNKDTKFRVVSSGIASPKASL